MTKEKSLELKASENVKSNIDEEQVVFLVKNFKKFFKRGNISDNKEESPKK